MLQKPRYPDNAQAVVKGLDYDGNNTVYDEKLITLSIGEGSTATYTVPSGVSGTYDIYLEVSRGLSI